MPEPLNQPASAAPRLSRCFYEVDAVRLARRLLGQRLVRVLDDGTRLSGVIVETEAYLGVEDLAAHTARGRRTARNASMWGPGGHAYVYFTYGMHHCMNVVAAKAEDPVAVLIRAIQPQEGLSAMQAVRPAARREQDLCAGPARLCQALRIDRTLDGEDLCRSDRLFIERLRQRALPTQQVVATPRIGIAYAGAWVDEPLRFFIRDSVFVSKGQRTAL